MKAHQIDVLVIGSGNAGFCAAHAAAGNGKRVVVIDAAPAEYLGGNSYFTAGATRIAHGGLESLQGIVDPDERHDVTEVPPYSVDDYRSDMERVTGGRNDKALTEILVNESFPTLQWLHGLGLRYRLMYERQSYLRDDGSYLFWGGLHVGNTGGGEGLIRDHLAVAEKEGVTVLPEHRALGIRPDDGSIVVTLQIAGGSPEEWVVPSVVLASGGFEADGELRERFLGAGWKRAKVRGTPYNDGRLLLDAIEHGAARGGDWASCHSVAWDAWNPHNESNLELTNRLTRQSYPLGVVVNRLGRRFLDEGADFRNYTYAKYGREILKQPDALAFQVFDAQTRPLLREEEYEMPGVSLVVADTLGELARQAGIDAAQFAQTIAEFNASIDTAVPLDPTVKDGRAARLPLPKSNWASPIAEPPYYAYPVTCAITFTFGGLATDVDGRVLGTDGSPIPGLFACGEALGGLFSDNYPGGSGLAAGAVFGRRAGIAA